ncbi:MAG TPA: DUF4097 family beta strand repeat-containing protein [Candidatus Angelobacter sp.]
MNKLNLTVAASVVVALGTLNATASDTHKEARLDVAPGGTINIVNNCGSVTLHGGPGKQVVVAYDIHSDKVEVDESTTSDKRRAEIRTHAVGEQRPTADEARVEYDVTVPAGIAVTVSTATAPITADGLSGDLTLSSDTGQITVRNVSKVHVHVRGVTAPVSLSSINNGHVEITSSGGAVQLVDVSGPVVSVGTTSGNISYRGDCSGGGDYSLTTHSGAIDVALPETASFDVSARSVSGLVQNDFPLQQKPHISYTPKPGSSFSGTSNSGSSSVELQSFSGRIRVKKQ